MHHKLFKQFRKQESVLSFLEEIRQKPFPEHFYRGFGTPDCFTPFGYVSAGAFQFKPNVNEPRLDDFNEASINWDDAPMALRVLLSQVNAKTGERQFRYGYVRIPMSDLLPMVRGHIDNGHFGFERSPLPNNIYHGNLLLHSSFKKAELKTFQDGLAMIANRFFRRDLIDQPEV